MTERNGLTADKAVRGLYRRLQNGRETWVVRYTIAGKARQKTLVASAARAARLEGAVILQQARLGIDVVAENTARTLAQRADADAARARQHRSVGSLVETYLSRGLAHTRPNTKRARRHLLLTVLSPLHGFDAETLPRSAIASLLSDIAATRGQTTRNRSLAALGVVLSWAVSEGLIEKIATLGLRALPEQPRSRVLPVQELRQVWAATGGFGDFGVIVRLLTLTGARRLEIGEMAWDELDLQSSLWRLPSERTKNKRPHELQLPIQAVEILAAQPRRGGRVFRVVSWSRAKAALDVLVQLSTPWVLHDLRRSVVTGMADIGIQPHVIEAVVNHVSGTRAGVAGIYNRSTYANEKRIALQAWASHLLGAGVGGNVVAFGR